MTSDRWLKLVAVLLLLVAVPGCNRGPKLVPAGGVVKYKSAVIPGADVVFVPVGDGQTAIGRTDEQGKFRLLTGGQPGALPGDYNVAITAARNKRDIPEAQAVTMSSEQIAANREDLVPIKYNNPLSSQLTATISKDEKSNDLVFDLK